MSRTLLLTMVTPRHNGDVFDLPAITSSDQLTSELALQAASSPAELKKLVARLGEVARPEDGWTKVLRVLGKVAVAGWMEGELQVDFQGDDKGTTVSLYSVLGAGIRERLVAPHYWAIPIDELQRAIVLAPDIVSPLRAHQGLNRLELAMGTEVRGKELLDFELEEKAKGDGERITMPPSSLALARQGALAAESVDVEHEAHTRPTAPPPVDAKD